MIFDTQAWIDKVVYVDKLEKICKLALLSCFNMSIKTEVVGEV